MEFKLTERQARANELLATPAQHIMLFGGSRSGKTFLLVRACIVRALKAPGSRHVILRFRLGHIKQSIVMDTFPKVMKLCFPTTQVKVNNSDLYARFENGSEIWFGGLDDRERVEKILGNEFSTIYLNECSQISWSSRNVAVTRLAQLVQQSIQDRADKPLPLKMYYDCNPPDKAHWTYRLFKLLIDPESKQLLPDPENYASMQLNPGDNLTNLGGDYIKTLKGLSARLQKRFLEGEFRDAAPNALFTEECIDKWRLIDGDLPDMVRVVVAVDPSGSDDTDNLDNDEIGICVCGLGVDGNAYLLEDITCKAGPATWGRIATQAFERHEANTVVAEVNYGGAMVKNVIHTARPRTPFKAVTASRGKAVRAEPIAALMEQGRIRFHGIFRALEDELCGFTTHGYTGERSPNRADACLIAGTLVVTQRGEVPIESVTTQDHVLTREGMKPIEWAGKTRDLADTVVLTLSSGARIVGTTEHPIWITAKGFVPISDIKVGDVLMPAHEVRRCSQSKSSLMINSIDAIPTTKTRHGNAITGASLGAVMACYTVISGHFIMAQSLKVGRFITETVISSIMILLTLNALLLVNIPNVMIPQSGESGIKLAFGRLSKRRLFGTQVQRGAVGTKLMQSACGRLKSARSLEIVPHVAKSSNRSDRTAAMPADIVRRNAIEWSLTKRIDIWLKLIAQYAASSFGKRSGAEKLPLVVVSVVSSIAKHDVYNLHVEGCHEFVANGALVHNCIWGMSELFPDLAKPEKKPVQNQIENRFYSQDSWMSL